VSARRLFTSGRTLDDGTIRQKLTGALKILIRWMLEARSSSTPPDEGASSNSLTAACSGERQTGRRASGTAAGSITQR
jgi:hypothetical protein